jgi:hypothetical protein
MKRTINFRQVLRLNHINDCECSRLKVIRKISPRPLGEGQGVRAAWRLLFQVVAAIVPQKSNATRPTNGRPVLRQKRLHTIALLC